MPSHSTTSRKFRDDRTGYAIRYDRVAIRPAEAPVGDDEERGKCAIFRAVADRRSAGDRDAVADGRPCGRRTRGK